MARDDVNISVGLDATDLNNSLKGVSNTVKAVGAAFVAAFAGGAVISGINAVTEAASIQDDAINSLNSALRRAGEFSEETSQEFQDFASALQSVTTAGDEGTLELLALAKSFGVTNDQAKELVETSIDAAAALGIDQRTALEQLGGTLSGVQGRLAKFVPEVKNLSKEALESGKAIAIFAEQFDGAAASLRNTFSGAVTVAQNAFGDLLEEIGFAITRNPAVIASLNALGDVFVEIGNFAKANKDIIADFISDSLVGLIDAVVLTAQVFRDNFEGITQTITVFSALTKTAFNGITAAAKAVQLVIIELAKSFEGWRIVINRALGDDGAVADAQTNLEALRDLSRDITADIATDGKDIEDALGDVSNAFADLPKDAGTDEFLKALNAIVNRLKDAKEIIESTPSLSSGGVSGGASGAVDGGASAVAQAEGAGQGFSDLRSTFDSVSDTIGSAATGFASGVLDAALAVGSTLANVLIGGAQAFAAASADEQAKIAKNAAEEFVTQASGAVVDVFLPGAGQFVTALLDLARDPESFQAFIVGFTEALPGVIESLVDAIPIVVDALVDALPFIIRAFINGLPDIIDAIIDALPSIIATLIELAPEIAIKLAIALVEAVPLIIDAFLVGINLGLIRVFDNLVQNIKDLFPGGGGGGGLGVDLGFARFAEGGVVPPGFPNDTFPALLTSGERILTEDEQRDMSRPQMITVNLVMNEEILASQILEVNRDNLRTT